MSAHSKIDLDFIDRSLQHVINFNRRRQAEKLLPVLMYEIPRDGESFYRTMTLREMLGYVNSESSNKGKDKAETITKQQAPSSSSTKARETIAEENQHIGHAAVSELRLRDLRRLDYQFNPNEEKSVLSRKNAVLFDMDPIRAVVMATRLILIVPDGADSLISILDKYMRGQGLLNAATCYAYMRN
jgi:hypothetical protein